jgi:thiol-disulfide isomerase/thioredoxin
MSRKTPPTVWHSWRYSALSARRFGAIAATAALALLTISACSDHDAVSTNQNPNLFVSGVNGTAYVEPSNRQPAPTLSGPTLAGTTLDIASLKGHVVVLNVWGSWCAPCRGEANNLENVYNATKASGVRFVGINTRDDNAAANAFDARFGITYPSIVDNDGSLLLGFRKSLPPQAIPSTLIIDAQGRVAGRVIGAVTVHDLTTLIQRVQTSDAA